MAGALTALVLAGIIRFLISAAHSDDMNVELGEKNPDVHMLYDHELVKVEPALEDYSFMMFDVCDAMGLYAASSLLNPTISVRT